MQAIVRLSPEISLKSKQVHTRFVNRLCSNMAAGAWALGLKLRLTRVWNRLIVESDDPTAIDYLARVFGIGSVSAVEHSCVPELEAMKEVAVEKYTAVVRGKTFCVRCKRNPNVRSFTSIEAEKELGAVLFGSSAGVDLTNPEVLIEVEVRPEGAFFFCERKKGPGGLPLGSEGRALSLISGGFDSAVSSYLMMKRGVECDFVFFNLAGQAYERSVLSVIKILCEGWSYGYNPQVYVVDFSNVVEELKLVTTDKYRQVVLKRAMVRSASRLAKSLGIQALITGEAIGQVSSQTFTNLSVIDQVSDLPVFRPLVSFDKEEIIDLARKIGTFAACSKVREYCSLVDRFPVTQARVDKVAYEESFLSGISGEMDIPAPRRIAVKEIQPEYLTEEYVYTEKIPTNSVIIDTRPRDEFRTWHYPGSENLDISYLLKLYGKLDKKKTYVLCCPFGLQTALVAEKMQREGYEAYSFRGGTRGLKAYAKTNGVN
ncbi:MAG: tRNA uracil 4-sulfurtransferase ThiI [Oligoflexales bacterium]